MFVEIDSIELYYERNFGTGTPVLLLHGWGGSSKTMSPVFNALAARGRSVISLDLAGFGQSQAPPSHFGIFDYADLVQKFVRHLELDTIIVVGHSFGGRIAIILAANYGLVSKAVLVDSAGMKPKRRLGYYIKVFRYKRAKKRGKNLEKYGSSDFLTLDEGMKKVFTKVVNQHLECLLKKISCPTLIIWGKNDADTPLYMARRLKKGIADSGLVVFDGAGHYSYLDNSTKFDIILHEFVRESDHSAS